MEAVFFPLDDEWNLPQRGLTPHVHQGLVLLGSLVPFASAAKHLETLLKVPVSPNGVRRLTEQAGKLLEQWQNHHAQPTSEGGPEEGRGERLAMATDGVLVPVLPNEWSEVKMTTMGEVSQTEEGQPHGEQLSYFARLANADTFGDRASFEMRRRGVDQAPAVAAVNDGAEWIQGCIHAHRADAVRILDFAHAAQDLSEIVTLVGQAGVTLSATWLSEHLRDLKEKGPGSVLAEVQRLQERVPTTEVSEKVASLCKREGQMPYPPYLDEGWPIGSGMAESGNKLVVQARLKGAGMHWQRSQVNPMLALRTTICSDRWPQDWHVVQDHWREERSQRFETPRQQALEKATLRLQQTFWRFPLPFLLACFPSPPPPPAVPKGRSAGQKRWGRRSFSPRAILDGRSVKGCVCKKMARTLRSRRYCTWCGISCILAYGISVLFSNENSQKSHLLGYELR